MIALDIECYSDYFLIMFKEIETSKVRYFELFPGQELKTNHIRTIMRNHQTVSFNGLNYDLPLIQATIEGQGYEALHKLSTKIIKTNRPSWSICKDNDIVVPLNEWDHIDLIEVAPGVASLKLYGGRLHAPKMQDLPIKPDASIDPEQRNELRRYCENDLDTTILLYNTLTPQIKLRESMSQQYKIDLRSKSDSQIAEAVIKSELTKKTGRTYKQRKIKDGHKVMYQDPKIVSFQDPELNRIFKKLLAHEFTFAPNGAIKLPKGLKETKITLGGGMYSMGIGGLHSNEKSQLVMSNGGILCELDVSSYYPSIILQQRLSPKTMGKDFLELYQGLVSRRLTAKKDGDMVTANTLKICLNGSYGKLGSKYSALYAPELLLQVTITGQLCLLMLIERMEAAGIQIVSANTDGIVCQCASDLERTMEEAAWDWSLDTTYTLERTDYELLASRDVNSYMAVKSDGKVKRKGIFNTGGLMKNPDRAIVYNAVVALLKDGAPIEATVRGCTDPGQFVTARRVTGGATFDGEEIGKAIRFYSSTDTMFVDPCIHYVLNGNKVSRSSGCRPLMEMNGKVPDDLNYQAYIDDANKLLKEVGYAGT
jgi:hypothetical protein